MNICTYFNYNYLPKFLVLYDSLNKLNNFNFYILALDQKVENFFHQNKKEYNNITIISEKVIRNHYKELEVAINNRSTVEYFFTLSPFLPMYIFSNFKISKLVYLDCDLFFYSDPTELIINSHYSITIVRQGNKDSRYGKLNVGFIIYNKDKFTLEKLKIWSNQCSDWCYDRISDEKYADQKYLDDWLKFDDNVKVLDCINYNVAPWNIEQKHYFVENSKLYHKTGKPVIFIHFHGLSFMKKNFFTSGFSIYNKNLNKIILKNIYYPYVNKLHEIEKRIAVKTSSKRSLLENQSLVIKIQLLLKNLKKNVKILIFKDFYSY